VKKVLSLVIGEVYDELGVDYDLVLSMEHVQIALEVYSDGFYHVVILESDLVPSALPVLVELGLLH
jgi:hypothetical protein